MKLTRKKKGKRVIRQITMEEGSVIQRKVQFKWF